MIIDYLAATKRYYAEWLSAAPALIDQDGKYCFYSPNRDVIQPGYSQPFNLYGYFSKQTTILTYGKRLEQHADWIQEILQSTDDLNAFKDTVRNKFGKTLQHSYKYYFTELPAEIDISKAKQLTKQDYSAYLRFFGTQYPDSSPESWLADYFTEITEKGYAFGLFVNNELVCASDAPEIPYMKELIVEIGINTLCSHRRKGYGKTVVAATIQFLTCQHKVPIASCASSNLASQTLLEQAGFVKLADVVHLTL